jgi:hypothetical protein
MNKEVTVDDSKNESQSTLGKRKEREVKEKKESKKTKPEKAYIVYTYHDYRKEFSVSWYDAYSNQQSAIDAASELGDGQQSTCEYVDHTGELFDEKEADSSYGRIAVDSVPFYRNSDGDVSEVFLVYNYHDYRKENGVTLYALYDTQNSALADATKRGDGLVTEAEYACQQGELFDEKEEDSSYGRVAVDRLNFISDTVTT